MVCVDLQKRKYLSYQKFNSSMKMQGKMLYDFKCLPNEGLKRQGSLPFQSKDLQFYGGKILKRLFHYSLLIENSVSLRYIYLRYS